MFSGIVEYLAKVGEIDTGEAPRIVISAPGFLGDVAIGDSIAVNGVCLTVTEMQEDKFAADVMPETLRKTDLEELKPGSRVNLEKSLRVGDRLGGHFVLGHVDGVGVVSGVTPEKNAVVIGIDVSEELMEFIASKGSVAVDGVSLTVVDITSTGFTVSLIPHTLDVTTLGEKKKGSPVNIEVDTLARYIRRQA
ncbi:MAG: riboflavin synthase [Actinomycetota bacterium]